MCKWAEISATLVQSSDQSKRFPTLVTCTHSHTDTQFCVSVCCSRDNRRFDPSISRSLIDQLSNIPAIFVLHLQTKTGSVQHRVFWEMLFFGRVSRIFNSALVGSYGDSHGASPPFCIYAAISSAVRTGEISNAADAIAPADLFGSGMFDAERWRGKSIRGVLWQCR